MALTGASAEVGCHEVHPWYHVMYSSGLSGTHEEFLQTQGLLLDVALLDPHQGAVLHLVPVSVLTPSSQQLGDLIPLGSDPPAMAVQQTVAQTDTLVPLLNTSSSSPHDTAVLE